MEQENGQAQFGLTRVFTDDEALVTAAMLGAGADPDKSSRLRERFVAIALG